jgi:hypothetical protein
VRTTTTGGVTFVAAMLLLLTLGGSTRTGCCCCCCCGWMAGGAGDTCAGGAGDTCAGGAAGGAGDGKGDDALSKAMPGGLHWWYQRSLRMHTLPSGQGPALLHSPSPHGVLPPQRLAPPHCDQSVRGAGASLPLLLLLLLLLPAGLSACDDVGLHCQK